jgi:hypothetical protein
MPPPVVETAVLRASDVEGFMSGEELTWSATRASELPPGSLIVEVGTWLGRWARAVVGAMPRGCLYVAVDHFGGNEEESAVDPETGGQPRKGTKQYRPRQLWHRWRQEFYEEMAPDDEIPERPVSVILVNLPSWRAAKLIAPASVDMLFIDGSHTYENVRADLSLWLPKRRPGGFVCGHNLTPDCPGVRQALDELLVGWRPEVGQIWSWRR